MKRHSITRIAATALIISAVFAASSSAQSSNAVTVIADWTDKAIENEAPPAISPDGTLVAHMQEAVPGQNGAYQLFLKNVATGADKLILSDANGQLLAGRIAFSPDGTRIAFGASGPHTASGGNLTTSVYTVAVDGSALRELAPGDPAAATYCKANLSARTQTPTVAPECSVFAPSYSPDGAWVMVDVAVNDGTRDSHNALNSPSTTYIGRVSATVTEQEPEKLIAASGRAFWSSDSTAIFYESGNGVIYRLDVNTKQTAATGVSARDLIMPLPAMDAVLLRKGTSIAAVNLRDGSDATANVSNALIRVISNVPMSDADGRPLSEIKSSADGSRLLIIYSGVIGGGHPSAYFDQHVMVVSVQ